MVWNWIEYTEAKWRNLDMDQLKVDEAYINVFTQDSLKKFWVYYLYDDCFKCPYAVLKHENSVIKVDVSRSFSLKIFDKNQGEYVFANETKSICTLTPMLGEFGVYNLTIEDKSCNIQTDKESVNIYASMVTILLLGLLFISLWKGVSYLWTKYCGIINVDNELDANGFDIHKSKKRLKSLDLFRGIVITLMIFVNSGGGHYYWIEHAPWNGLNLADIVFPAFLWIMGVCIPFSINSQLNRSVTKTELFKNILTRSIKLFLIGFFLNSINGPQLENLRIMGVLQRFGISYLICASFYTIFVKYPVLIPEVGFKSYIFDIILMKEEILLVFILAIVNISVIFGLKIPNCPQGYLGPGGKHEYGMYPNCTGGTIGYIDEIVLTKNHMYQHSTAKILYNAKNFDPEGLFGCILSIVQVLLGVQCGVILNTFTNFKSRAFRIFIWGSLLCLVGGALCSFTKENGFIPINKNLWSLSYVMVTSGGAFLILLLLYVIADHKNLWDGYPFVQAGMNSIILYVGHTIMHKMLPWHWRFGNMNTHFILLLECLWNTVLWVLIAIYLHSKNIFYNI